MWMDVSVRDFWGLKNEAARCSSGMESDLTAYVGQQLDRVA